MKKLKVTEAVKRESIYVAIWVGVLSLLMEAVFLICGWWETGVLLGNILGGAAAVLNFFLMGLSVQKAVEKDEKEGAKIMKLSLTGRNFMLLAVALCGAIIPVFNMWAVLIPLLFPRIGINFRGLLERRG